LQASSERMTGWPVWSLCQIAAVRRGCAAGRGQGRRRGVAAVSFEVELAFEGVVNRFDDLAQRPEEPRWAALRPRSAAGLWGKDRAASSRFAYPTGGMARSARTAGSGAFAASAARMTAPGRSAYSRRSSPGG